LKTTYLIDGNNVIHSITALQKQFLTDPEAAAKALVEMCKARLNKKVKIVFVFDGYGKSNSNSIIFSGNKKADEIICNLIESNYLREQITVVSSDREILSKAKVYGCEIMSSKQFKELLKGQITKQEKPEYPTKKELEEFIKYFTQ
jgi:predicted RNA-binding protein with PIN domain